MEYEGRGCFQIYFLESFYKIEIKEAIVPMTEEHHKCHFGKF